MGRVRGYVGECSIYIVYLTPPNTGRHLRRGEPGFDPQSILTSGRPVMMECQIESVTGRLGVWSSRDTSPSEGP